MVTATIDTTGLDRGMRALIQKAGLNAKVVVEKETGELIKTLVKVSPPGDPAATRARIALNVSGKFQALSDNLPQPSISQDGMDWYAWDSNYLYGTGPDKDMTKASVEELRQLLYRTRISGGKARQILGFTHPRSRQRVAITQRILAKASRIKQLISRIQRHVGRLKAGWLVAVTYGRINLSGANLPPSWVTRHSKGAKGSYIDGTGNKNNPSFTISNTAKGIGGKTVNYLVKKAVSIRAKAMQVNAALFFSGKKPLSAYVG